MEGRAFLDVAERLVLGSTEADWRSAAGRAYYAVMLECRAALRRWGFTIPKGEQVHRFVRLRFLYASDTDLKTVAHRLEQVGLLRNQSDYELESPGPFASDSQAAQATRWGRNACCS
ncbi:MAG TPA: hypothetical protein VG099_30300 [Gemmataceae bacterium]|jgi:hypothetical protein|nr:hypothetical protein [Gemmataceae bacterium]